MKHAPVFVNLVCPNLKLKTKINISYIILGPPGNREGCAVFDDDPNYNWETKHKMMLLSLSFYFIILYMFKVKVHSFFINTEMYSIVQ